MELMRQRGAWYCCRRGIHQKEIVRLRAVADENDRLPIGGVVRLSIEGLSAHETRGLSAGDGDGVDVAEEIEDDRLAVGGEVEDHTRLLFPPPPRRR